MKIKYCDHGAYSVNATFTFDTQNYSDRINVRNVVGTIAPGARLVSTLYGDGNRGITGGSGTSFVVNQYMNQNSVANQTAQAFGGFLRDPATWGVPIEGDGLAKSPSAAAATVTIDMSGASAVAGNTFIVAGAVLTCNAGNGVDQFAPASGAGLVAALVAAINRSNNGTRVNAADTGWYQHKIQDALFARVDPANATNLQIMTRAGSAKYNANTNFSITYSGMTGLAQPNYIFDGGASGCWGVFMAGVAMWPSGISAGQYGIGLAFGGSIGGTAAIPPLAGVRASGDRIVVRSHNKIGGSTVWSGGDNYSCYVGANEGTATEAVVFDFDDGTEWPQDVVGGKKPIFRFTWPGSQYQRLRINSYGNGMLHMKGKRYADGQRNCVFECYQGSANNVNIHLIAGGPAIYDNLDIIAMDGNAYVAIIQDGSNPYIQKTLMRGVRVLWQSQNASRVFLNMNTANYSVSLLESYDLTLELASSNSIQPAIVQFMNGGNSSAVRTFIDGLNLIGFLQGSTFHGGGQSTGNSCSAVIRNVNPGSVTNFGPSFSTWSVADQRISYGDIGIFISSDIGAGLLAMDTALGFYGWSPLQDPPCLNARRRDGTAWSIRIMPSTQLNNLNILNPLPVNGGAKTVLSAGRKTVTANFLLEKSMAWTARDVGLTVTYTDISGKVRTEHSMAFNDGTPLSPASNAWIKPGGGSAMAVDPADGVQRVGFADVGGLLYFNQFALSVQTTYPVAAESDINWTFRVGRTVANTLQQVFLDPDVQLGDVA